MLRDQIPLPDFAPGGPLYVPAEPANDTPSKIVGDYFLKKYRDRAAQVGVQPVARQLRKQGVDVEVAALILAVRQ
jgi:hypothetical protein